MTRDTVIDYIHTTMNKVYHALGLPGVPRAHYEKQHETVLRGTWKMLRDVECERPATTHHVPK